MKIFFYQKYEKCITTYTFELLKYLAKENGHEISKDASYADICAISLTSFYEIDTLRIFRNRHPNVKIIVGGHACNNPSALLRYADYVCLGQAFQFFSENKTIEDIKNKSYVVHKNKLYGKYSQYIDWQKIPLIQTSKNNYSYLYSTGCRNKCKFCLTSWANKYQVNPFVHKIEKIKKYTEGKRLCLIANDYDQGVFVKRDASDITIKEYLKNPKHYDGVKLLRLGVESPVQKTRSFFSKPIKDKSLQDVFNITKRHKKRINIFMIAGLDTQEGWESFADLLEQDYYGLPKIGVIINYFDPQPLTPLANWDVRGLIPINIPRIKRIWRQKSVRIIIYRDLDLKPYNAIYNTMLSRANWYDVDKIMDMRKNEKFIWGKVKERQELGLPYMFEKIKTYGLEHLVDGTSMQEVVLNKIAAKRATS